ncbi:unnamed protein product [Mytilus edulis]|uniref:PHD-type domain-containing protein n=1 Tax=Mytilus edulis TaxID=6550 RepID=A0A8S3TEC9_MYTED|nr:unnamed protein product [Mytilus edulis]
MQPKLLASMPPKKSNRSKSVKSRTLMPTSRKSFDPITTEKGEILSSFAIAMRGILPNACIFRGLPKDDVNEHRTEEITEDHKETEGPTGSETEDPTGPETEDPAGPETEDPTRNEIDILHISNYTLDFITSKFQSQTSCYDFFNFLPKLTDDEVFFIEKSTVGQHDNCNWFSLRKGRITASKFYQIFTKVNSIKSKSSIDSNSLIKIVMGYTSVNPNIKSLKHGRETEPIANHSYYTQVQGQIAITGRKWCDLFIFTVNGYLQQRIVLDEETFYNVLFPNLKYFFINCILPELLNPKLNSVEQIPESMEVETSLCDTQSYFCSICKNFIKESENVSKYNERSVGCDKCEMWFHFPCVKFTKTDSKKKTWFCPNCR